MKSRIYLCLILFLTTTCLLFILSPTGLYGGGETNLSQTPEMSELPFILALPDGSLMAAWTDGGHFNGGGSVWYSIHRPGSGWSAPQQAALPTSAFPQLAVDGRGVVHMAYWEGGSSTSRDIYYRTYSDGRWSDKQLVYDSWGYNSNWQRINVQGSTVSILWCHSYAKPAPVDIVLIEKSLDGSWPTDYVNVSRSPNSVSVHPFFRVKNGDVYAAWQDDRHAQDIWNIYYAERINGFWSQPVRIDPGPRQYQCALDVDNQGQVHLIYSGKNGPIYYLRKTAAGGWTSPEIISSAGTDIATFTYLKFAQGSLHAVWRQHEGEGNYIFYGRGNTSGQWDPPQKVSHGGFSEYPVLDIDKQGGVHVVYSDLGVGGERDIFYVRVDQVTSHPVAQFTAVPDEGNPPLKVDFDASNSYDPDGSVTDYTWDFGDGASGSGVKTTHTYTQRGFFTAVLTVTDNEDNSSTAGHPITVGTPPQAVIKAVPTSGSKPLTVYFDGTSSYDPDGQITAYNWSFGDGTTDTGPSPIHTYYNNGIYTASLTVEDNEGFQAGDTIGIQVSSSPIARFTYSPHNGDPPLKVTFNASNSVPADRTNGNIAAYEWDFDDGERGTGKIITHTFKEPGSYSVALRVTDNQGLTSAVAHPVEVYSKPVARFTFSPQTGLAPLKILFDASSSYDKDGYLTKYRWLFGDGSVGYGKTISHTYTRGGGYTIWLTVTDNKGWTAAASRSLIVTEKPHPPQNFRVIPIVMRGLYFSGYINRLEWSRNPINTGPILPVKYRIYRSTAGAGSGFTLLTEVDGNTFHYEDSGLDNESDLLSCSYALSAIDDKGRESEWVIKAAAASASPRPSGTAAKLKPNYLISAASIDKKTVLESPSAREKRAGNRIPE